MYIFFRARQALALCLPDQLKNAFSSCIITDYTISIWLVLLKNNLESEKPIDTFSDE